MLQLNSTRQYLSTFVKTDSHQTVEILGLAKLDFLVVDAEHAPFDRNQLDRMMLAGRAAGIPVLVRIPDHSPAHIQSVLDMGAAGIVVPHVDSVEQAQEVIACARFRGGKRGLSLSPRFANYATVPRRDALDQADRALILCQIESAAAVAVVDAIAALPDVHSLFIGRSDLSMSMGLDNAKDPAVTAAVQTIIDAGRHHGKTVTVAIGSGSEIAEYRALGANCFVVGSDQSLLRQAAAGLRKHLDA